MKRTKNTLVTILLACLVAAMTGFIWSQSAKTGDESASLSVRFTVRLLGVLGKLFSFTPPVPDTPAFETVHMLVRKCAHFTEFCFLGILWLLLTASVTGRSAWRRSRKTDGQTGKRTVYFLLPPCAAFLTAAIDECLQMFSVDRGPSVVDVGIDFFGACAGIVLAHAFLYVFAKLVSRRKNRRNEGTVYVTNERNIQQETPKETPKETPDKEED